MRQYLVYFAARRLRSEVSSIAENGGDATATCQPTGRQGVRLQARYLPGSDG